MFKICGKILGNSAAHMKRSVLATWSPSPGVFFLFCFFWFTPFSCYFLFTLLPFFSTNATKLRVSTSSITSQPISSASSASPRVNLLSTHHFVRLYVSWPRNIDQLVQERSSTKSCWKSCNILSLLLHNFNDNPWCFRLSHSPLFHFLDGGTVSYEWL